MDTRYFILEPKEAHHSNHFHICIILVSIAYGFKCSTLNNGIAAGKSWEAMIPVCCGPLAENLNVLMTAFSSWEIPPTAEVTADVTADVAADVAAEVTMVVKGPNTESVRPFVRYDHAAISVYSRRQKHTRNALRAATTPRENVPKTRGISPSDK